MKRQLSILKGVFAIVQIQPGSKIPQQVGDDGLFAFLSTPDEVSIVCEERIVPKDGKFSAGWKTLMVQGPLDFSLVGILADISSVLAKAEISIFALSTYNTDYILLKQSHLDKAVKALNRAGYEIVGE